jgi:hypothetical protein
MLIVINYIQNKMENKMEKIILSSLLLCLMLSSGCLNVDIHQPDVISPTTTDDGLVCDVPYIFVGNDCCLDKDENSICDKDEISDIENREVEETEADSKEVSNNPIVNEIIPLEDSVYNCEFPYLENSDGCCLDENEDLICDSSDDELECGNGICSSDESLITCCVDCGCSSGKTCVDNECGDTSVQDLKLVFKMPEMKIFACGDEICDTDAENSTNCCEDCGCEEGLCSDGVCQTPVLFGGIKPMEIEGYVAPIDPPPTTDYLVVVINSISFKGAAMYDDYNDEYAELMMFTQASVDGSKYNVKWPIGDAKPFKNNYEYDSSVYPDVPVYSQEVDQIYDNIKIDVLISELDGVSPLRDIHSDTTLEDVRSKFSGGNDLLADFQIVIHSPQTIDYNTDSYENDDISVNYEIRRVSVIDNLMINAQGEDVGLYDNGELEYNDEIEGIVWYRIFNGKFAGDSFGVGTNEEHQIVGGKELDSGYYGSASIDLSKSYGGWAGPVLYLEFQVLERDDFCKPYNFAQNLPCYGSDKIKTSDVFTKLFWMDEAPFNINLDTEYNELLSFSTKMVGEMDGTYRVVREVYS